MDPLLKAQLKHVIGYVTGATIDAAGQVQVVAASVATCFGRVEPYYREIPVGSDIVDERTKHMVILDESFPLTEEACRAALFYLPAIASQGRRPKNVQYCYDENAALDHIEVML